MKKKNGTILILMDAVLMIPLLAIIGGCARESKEQRDLPPQQTPFQKQTTGVKQGELAPDFVFEGMLNGSGLTAGKLSDLRGKVVLLNFWASWCVYCDKEMASLQALAETFHDKNFVLLGINDGEGQDTARNYVEGKNLTFPMVLDPSKNVAQKYRIRSIPTTFLLNKEGVIVTVIIGALDWNQPAIQDTIRRLLEE